MRSLTTGAVAVLLLLTGIGCHSHGPRTRCMVYNQSMSAFEVEGHQIEVSHSNSVYATHGAVDTLDVKRNAVVARLVITSLVAAEDLNDYDAAINMHEDVAGVLYCNEYSPYIDAEIIAP